jgi:hypothetical protein
MDGGAFDQGSLPAHFVRIFVTVAILLVLLLAGLLLFERSGSSPSAPTGRNISSNQPAAHGGPSDVTTTTDNPNAHCKPNEPPTTHDCRPPSGP